MLETDRPWSLSARNRGAVYHEVTGVLVVLPCLDSELPSELSRATRISEWVPF